MEPVDDGVSFEVELGGQHLDGVLRGVRLLEIRLPQSLLLLCRQHHSGFLGLAEGAELQRGQTRTDAVRMSAGGIAV